MLAILELPQPMAAVKLLLDGLTMDLEACEPGSLNEAKLLQDLVYVHFQEQCGFRPGTSIALTWRSDNGGNLKHDEQGWYLNVNKASFKNAGGKALKNDFHRRLDDRWGFYGHLEKYLNWARPKLLVGLKTDALLLYGGAELERQTKGIVRGLADERDNIRETTLANRVRSFTRRHLGCHEATRTGIPGITKFGPTGFRHILATAIVKQSLNLQLAADAITDPLEVTRAHYAHYLPSDREEKRVQAQRDAAATAEKSARYFALAIALAVKKPI